MRRHINAQRVTFLATMVVCAVTSAAWGVSLTIGDIYYVGSITDGIPSSPDDEVTYINYLISLDPGDGDVALPDSSGETYNRVGSTLAGDLPEVFPGGVRDEEDINPLFDEFIDVPSGFSYVLAKYDAHHAGSLVWLLDPIPEGEVLTVDVPTTYNSKGLSHLTLHTTTLPDGGITVLLLGLSCLGMTLLQRVIGAARVTP